MRLVECEITRFGTLENYRYTFNDGLNVILRENGTGKSTLAAFIRCMFYGLEGTGSKLETNERKKYAPWKGGNFGGRITLECGGQRLTIERSFGAKAVEDTLIVRDADTNMILPEYEGVNVGEKLFGLSRESFMHTAFITQEKVQTSATSDMASKMGKLSSFDDDMKRYDSAMDRLKKDLDRTSDTRKTGELRALRDEITSLEREVRTIPDMERSLKSIADKMEEAEAEEEKLRREREELSGRQDALSVKKDLLAKKVEYDHLVSAVENRRTDAKVIRGRLPGIIPDMAELRSYENSAEELIRLESSRDAKALERQELAELERLKAESGEQSDRSTIQKVIDEWNECLALRTLLSEDCAKIESCEKTIELNRAARNREAAARRTKKRAFVIAGIVLIVLGIASVFVLPIGVGIALAAIGILSAVMGLMGGIREASEGTSFEEQEAERLKKKNEETRSGIAQIEHRTSEWCDEHGIPFDPHDLLSALYSYREKKNNEKSHLNILKTRYDAYCALRDKCRGMTLDIERYIGRLELPELPSEPSGNTLSRLIRALHSALSDYTEAETLLKSAEQELEAFEKNTARIEEIKSLQDTSQQSDDDTLGAISERLAKINADIDELAHVRAAYRKQRDDLAERYDDAMDINDELSEKRKNLTKGIENRRYIQLASDFLCRAETNMTAKYAGPIKEAFDRYYTMITGLSAETVHIDAQTKLTYDSEGKQRELETLSPGFRDLYGVALRMSYVSAMFEQEKPPVIFDDPFVNLDARKIEGAMELLTELSKEYQIVYFTCHESRANK